MTAILKSSLLVSPQEYLQGELVSEVRHEYIDGHVYAMAGASQDHNRITGNIFSFLHEHLRGKRCEPFVTDMKVRTPPDISDAFYYPDVLVSCDPADQKDYYREQPTIIFEVLSPDTERIDRREKAMAYWTIPSLKAYVLVEQSRALITVLRRGANGWKSQIIEGLDSRLRLPEIKVEIPFGRIYERTSIASRGA
jgi:Uma2 family endonuclease